MDLFDLHCDTITKCLEQSLPLTDDRLAVSSVKGACFNKWVQVFALFMPDTLRGGGAVRYYDRMLSAFRREMSRCAGRFEFCTDTVGINRAHKSGKAAAILAVEGASVLAGDITRVDRIYSDGVRIVTLTWNGDNELASGAAATGGFTQFGRDAVNRMNELGIVIDVSHLNDRGFGELCAMTDSAFIASHSCLRSVKDHRRNLADEQFREIIARNGIVGLNLYTDFLGDKGFESVYAHLSAMLDLGGENVVAMGSDFDGADMTETLDSIEKLNALGDYLCGKLPEATVHKFFYSNAYSFFERLS